MFPYARSISPTARQHLEAQLAFFNGMSKSLFQSLQQLNDLNMRLAQSLLEESAIASQHLVTAERAEDTFHLAATASQPLAERLRHYQQQASRLAADAQVDLANVAEQHIAETSRTARALAEELARTASEETEKNTRKQQDALQRIAEPLQAFQNGARRERGAQGHEAQSMQSAEHGNQQSAQQDRQQGAAEGSAGQAAGTQGKGSRKD